MNKKLIVITGASSGIGAALAKTFSAAGYPLAVLARNLENLQALGLSNVVCQAADVTDFVAIKNAIKVAEEKYGPVDCLINNAGFVKAGDFAEVTHQDNQKTIEVNLQGTINGIEAVLPGMRERKQGTIINMSSVADRNVRPNIATYAASKAAIKSLTESLRVANAKYNIRFCNIAPAKVKTQMAITAGLDTGFLIAPEDLASLVLMVYQQPQMICIRDLVIAPTSYEP